MTTEYLLKAQVDHVLALLTPANALVIRVSLHTGLRVGDVLSLRTADIKPRMWVKEHKTGKCKRIGLPKPLREALLAQAGELYVFPNRLDKSRHRTRQAVWEDVKRASQALRLPQNVAPHSMRKVYAVELMRKYGDIDKVRRVLNHRYETTTMVYALADMLLQKKNGRKKYRGVLV